MVVAMIPMIATGYVPLTSIFTLSFRTHGRFNSHSLTSLSFQNIVSSKSHHLHSDSAKIVPRAKSFVFNHLALGITFESVRFWHVSYNSEGRTESEQTITKFILYYSVGLSIELGENALGLFFNCSLSSVSISAELNVPLIISIGLVGSMIGSIMGVIIDSDSSVGSYIE